MVRPRLVAPPVLRHPRVLVRVHTSRQSGCQYSTITGWLPNTYSVVVTVTDRVEYPPRPRRRSSCTALGDPNSDPPRPVPSGRRGSAGCCRRGCGSPRRRCSQSVSPRVSMRLPASQAAACQKTRGLQRERKQKESLPLDIERHLILDYATGSVHHIERDDLLPRFP